MTDHAPFLRVQGVSKRFPAEVQALDRVDLVIEKGETVALIGESGSGKSTLLRMFNRLLEPSDGEIFLQGRPLREYDPIELRRSIGYVQQEGGLLPHWNVARNVGLVPRLLGWERVRLDQRVRELLELVALPHDEYGGRYPNQLSGGQRQRVAFARALAADPEMVLLDEPFGALDALTRAELQEQFLQLEQRLVKTLVLVTHDLDEAFLLGDRVAVLREGRILRVDTPDRLLENPDDDYVAALLARMRHRELRRGGALGG